MRPIYSRISTPHNDYDWYLIVIGTVAYGARNCTQGETVNATQTQIKTKFLRFLYSIEHFYQLSLRIDNDFATVSEATNQPDNSDNDFLCTSSI